VNAIHPYTIAAITFQQRGERHSPLHNACAKTKCGKL
jgi:hypothetical protein